VKQVPTQSLANLIETSFINLLKSDEGKSIVRSNSGKYIAIGGTAGVIRLLDYSSGEEVASARGHSNTITKLAFSPDDRQLVSVGQDGCIFIWCIFTN